MLHEVRDQTGAMEAVTVGSHRVQSVREIPLAVAQAFADMSCGRPRPRHLESPFDLLDTVAEVRIVNPDVITRTAADPTFAAPLVSTANGQGHRARRPRL